MKRTTDTKAAAGRRAIDGVVDVFKALADRTRLRILALLGRNEVCVCHIHGSLGVPQPTVSRHLAWLRRVGLVEARRDGVWMHYRIARSLDPAVRRVIEAAVDAVAQVPLASEDRRQFQRAFGDLYVIRSRSGGACCLPVVRGGADGD